MHPFILRLNDGRVGTPLASFEQRDITLYALETVNEAIDLVATLLKDDLGFAADFNKVWFVFGGVKL